MLSDAGKLVPRVLSLSAALQSNRGSSRLDAAHHTPDHLTSITTGDGGSRNFQAVIFCLAQSI